MVGTSDKDYSCNHTYMLCICLTCCLHYGKLLDKNSFIDLMKTLISVVMVIRIIYMSNFLWRTTTNRRNLKP